MISRDNMIRHGMYAEELTNMEDVDLFLRLLCSLDFKFCRAIVAKTRRIDRSAQSRLGQNYKATVRINRAHSYESFSDGANWQRI